MGILMIGSLDGGRGVEALEGYFTREGLEIIVWRFCLLRDDVIIK